MCVCVCVFVSHNVTSNCYFPLQVELNKVRSIWEIRLEQSVSVKSDMKKEEKRKRKYCGVKIKKRIKYSLPSTV